MHIITKNIIIHKYTDPNPNDNRFRVFIKNKPFACKGIDDLKKTIKKELGEEGLKELPVEL